MRLSLNMFGVSICAAMLWATVALTQDSPLPAAVATTVPTPAPTTGSTVIVPVSKPAEENGIVTLDFQEADIRNVLKVLAFKTGMNIVAGPEVTGNVTIQLKEVPWQKALEVILSTYGFGYEMRGNIIKVMSIENLKKYHEDAVALQGQEPLLTKTFVLSFAKASDVVESIGKMRTDRGSVNFDQRTNTIIVRDVQNNIDLISDVVKSLDSVTPQVLIEAKVIETTLSDDDKIGVDWVVKASINAGKRPTSFPFDPDASNKFLQGTFGTPGSSLFSYGTIDASQFSATLELLDSRSDTNILSNPRIVTLDNQTARIVVGSQYPIPQYTYNTEQAKLQVSGWDYKDIGIIFEVTPHVNNAGLVTLDLQPKITAILDFVTVENTSLPRLSTEEAKTKVMVRDGDTLVIAGLIKDQTTITKKKVPFLGDIPLAGAAFRKNTTSKTKSEMLIFLTPHIITAKNIQEKLSSDK